MGGGSYMVVSEHGSALGQYRIYACCYECVALIKVVKCTTWHYDVVGMLWGWHFFQDRVGDVDY